MAVINRERWRELQPLLDRALELSDEERASWLEDLHSSAPDLAAELTSLLSGEAVADQQGFLAEPLAGGPRDSTLAGLELGAYTLERALGQGGMGSVWLARRSDGRFEGKAAVKLLNLALVSPAGQERFRREGSVLARLTHSGIARLLDAGVSAGGQPYLVLEYVDGKRIDVFADERGLVVEERVRLFLQVLSAVSHAHGNLIVHRDLKPSNILVTADGTAKLLDFGLAKLLESGTTSDDAPETRSAQRAMTPEYAAPEQVRCEPVTTRTDVYQLGVVLYELLAGRRPFVAASLYELEQAVLSNEPVPPSAAVLGRQSRALRGDLDAIVLKAIHKDPEQRYGSVEAFADDLRRYLSEYPVRARRPTAGYRLRRFARRHVWPLAAAASIVLLASGYLVTLTLSQRRIRRALAEATAGTHRAEQVTDFMLGLFEASEGGKVLTDTVTARQLLGQGVTRARELSGQPELQAQMLDVVGRIHTQLGVYDQAKALLEEALAIRRRLHGENHLDVVTSIESLADVADRKQDVATTVALRRQALALRRALSGVEDPKAIDALFELGHALHRAGDMRTANPLFDEWMVVTARRPREVSAERAEQLTTVGTVLQLSGQLDRAEAMFREALAINRTLYGEQHREVAMSLGALAGLFDHAQRREEAEPLARTAVEMLQETYPNGHPEMASELRRWGIILEHLKRFQDAQAPLREALAMRRRFLGDDAIDIAMAEMDLAYALTMSETYDESETLSRDAIRILRREFGDNNSMVSYARAHLGDALRGQGRYAEAEPLLLAAYARFAKPNPVTKQWRGYALAALVRLYEVQGRQDEAAKYSAILDSARRR